MSRDYARITARTSYLAPKNLPGESINAAINTQTILFKFIIGIYVPKEIWAYGEITSSS